MVSIATATPCGMDDTRTVVVQVLSHGEVRINSEDLRREDLDARLEEIFRTRAVRLAFVVGDPELQFRQVAEVIDTTAKHVDYVAIVTTSVGKIARWSTGNCLDPNLKAPLIDRSLM